MLNNSQRILVEAVKNAKDIHIVCNKYSEDSFTVTVDTDIKMLTHEVALAIQKWFNKQNYLLDNEKVLPTSMRL